MTRGYLSEDQGDQETVTLAYERVVRETAKALCISMHGDKETWIPKSLIREHEEDAKALDVPEWFAVKEGLI